MPSYGASIRHSVPYCSKAECKCVKVGVVDGEWRMCLLSDLQWTMVSHTLAKCFHCITVMQSFSNHNHTITTMCRKMCVKGANVPLKKMMRSTIESDIFWLTLLSYNINHYYSESCNLKNVHRWPSWALIDHFPQMHHYKHTYTLKHIYLKH